LVISNSFVTKNSVFLTKNDRWGILMLSVIVHIGGNLAQRKVNILECFRSLMIQDYHEYELVIVEQSLAGELYWHDISAFLFPARKYQAIYGSEYCGSWARNVGAKVATGDLLLFLDADTLFKYTYLSTVMSLFQPEDGYAVGYRLCHRLNEEGKEAYLRGVLYECIPDSMIMYSFVPDRRKSCGASLVITRKLFDLIGGYNEGIHFKEDKDIIVRLMNSPHTKLHDKLLMLDYVIADLPHERIELQKSYVSHAFKHYIVIHTDQIGEMQKRYGYGLPERRLIIDLIRYFRDGEVHYLPHTALTYKAYLELTGGIEW
jgi:glycosyltransferase involved in cell wall biosynthesis